jgi:hypothetical protein
MALALLKSGSLLLLVAISILQRSRSLPLVQPLTINGSCVNGHVEKDLPQYNTPVTQHGSLSPRTDKLKSTNAPLSQNEF